MAESDLKLGIALSGGGVRAAVFHLGVLGRLGRRQAFRENYAHLYRFRRHACNGFGLFRCWKQMADERFLSQ